MEAHTTMTRPHHESGSSMHSLSHQASPCKQSARLRHPRSRCSQTSTTNIFLLFLFCCCFTIVNARLLYIEEQMVEGRSEEAFEDSRSTVARLARSGTILVDLSEPPRPAPWGLEDDINNEDLRRRAVEASSSSAASAASTLTTSTANSNAAASSTLASTTTSSSSSSSAVQTGGPLPTPFDIGFNNNITASCQSFMTSMLSNSTFKACLPFSLLLQNSNSFFQASKSIVRTTQILDYACAADVNRCSNLLSSFASNITSTSACSVDLANQNPSITYAHLGLLAYRPLYTASCLRDPDTSSYCFGEAITNTTNPSDGYIYFLPLNQSLVGGSQPTCSKCLQQTMNVFEQASSDRKSALASDYVAAAMQVNVNCGPNFVNSSLAPVLTSSSSVLQPPSWKVSGALGTVWIALLVGLLGNYIL